MKGPQALKTLSQKALHMGLLYPLGAQRRHPARPARSAHPFLSPQAVAAKMLAASQAAAMVSR